MLKFKDRWDHLLLYAMCGSYLDNQTEANALKFLERCQEYIKKYCEEVK